MPSIILQTIGFFSPYWIKNDATSDCFRGVWYNVGCQDNVEGKTIITFKIFKTFNFDKISFKVFINADVFFQGLGITVLGL